MQINPDFEEFESRYRKGEAQVVFTRLVADLETPVSAMLKLARNEHYSFLLESVEGGAVRGRYSIIGLKPDVIWRSNGREAQVNRKALIDPKGPFEAYGSDPLQSLRMLLAPSAAERRLLGAIPYTRNLAVLHRDPALMPRRRAVWSSWNYIGESRDEGAQPLCVTYWMNRLQNLDCRHPLFVTLNPTSEAAQSKVIGRYHYTHPLFDQRALDAQQQLWRLQGRRNTWFCGAYFGFGFHEDGLQAGLAAAESVADVRRPWRVRDESGRVALQPRLEAAE